MKFAILALLVLLPLVAAPQVPIPYTNCGSDSDHVKITSAFASMWPLVPGQAVTLTLGAHLDESLPGGTYIAAVSLDGFPIINQQGTLASLDPKIVWPIPAGDFNLNKTVTIPSIIPGGTTVVANVSALDSNGQELLCIGLEIDIPSTEEDFEEAEIAFEGEEIAPEDEDVPLFKDDAPAEDDEDLVVSEAELMAEIEDASNSN